MNKSFEKFKRNEWAAAIALSVAIGVSAGLFAVGAVLLILKLCGVVINELYYGAIGVGTAAAAFTLAFLLLRPNGKKVAKELDEEFALREKVQTAYEYSAASGAMVERQREDAYATLDALPRRRVNVGRLVLGLCTGVVALALFFTAAFVPFRNAGADPEDPPFELTDWEETRIRGLIENVQKSNLAQAEKDGAVEALNGLIDALGAAATESGKIAALTVTLGQIDEILLKPNRYPALASALGDVEEEKLAEIVTRGGETYRLYTLLDYADVVSFYGQRSILVDERLEKRWEAYRALFADGEGLAAFLGETGANAAAAVVASGLSAADPLGSIFSEFSRSLFDLRNELAGTPEAAAEPAPGEEESGEEPEPEPSAAQKKLDSLFGSMTDALASALGDESYRGAMDRHIGNFLKDLFHLPIEEGEPDPDGTGEGDNDPTKPPDGDDKEDQQGGWGSGEIQYGSNDEVYDPYVGGYVKYGEALERYIGDMQKLLMEGDLTEEQRAMVQRYIEMLYNGVPAEEE